MLQRRFEDFIETFSSIATALIHWTVQLKDCLRIMSMYLHEFHRKLILSHLFVFCNLNFFFHLKGKADIKNFTSRYNETKQWNCTTIHPMVSSLVFINKKKPKESSIAIFPWTVLNLPLISKSGWLTVEEIPLKLKQMNVCCICPSSKCQCSADWMHIDRDNCGAMFCQGKGRETQWPGLVTHPQHCRPAG